MTTSDILGGSQATARCCVFGDAVGGVTFAGRFADEKSVIAILANLG